MACCPATQPLQALPREPRGASCLVQFPQAAMDGGDPVSRDDGGMRQQRGLFRAAKSVRSSNFVHS
eukprot:1149081-Pelagomonas_calceolata.AAC.9